MVSVIRVPVNQPTILVAKNSPFQKGLRLDVRGHAGARLPVIIAKSRRNLEMLVYGKKEVRRSRRTVGSGE
jgi:hypothetical protein